MAQPTEVKFELERLALEGGELVVSGFWTGVRGMRFIRPTLLCDDRRILATLEHKPWAPSDEAPWTAAFPWTGGGAVDADGLALAVAPRVIVQLGEAAPAAPAAARAAPPAPVRPPDRAPPTSPVIPGHVRSDDLARTLAAVERDRDRALAQRDEALIAYRTLQRRLQAEHAQADRHARGQSDRGETDEEAPLGVRTVPAMRGVLAELQYPPREPKRRLATFDMWVVRVIGLAAAACSIALLLTIVRAVG